MKQKKNKYPKVEPIKIDEDYSIEKLIEEFQKSGVFVFTL